MSAVLCPWRVHDEDIAWVRVARTLAPALHAVARGNLPFSVDDAEKLAQALLSAVALSRGQTA